MVQSIIFLVVWFVLLIKWADLLVEWAWSVAKRMWISTMIIWLTVVAFWTSAPEFIVSFMSALEWKWDLAISNVVWSNITNIALILGITSILYPIFMPKDTVKKEIPIALLSCFLLSFLLSDGKLNYIDWIIFLIVFSLFLYYIYQSAKKSRNSFINEEIVKMSTMKSVIFVILWLGWLIFWWKLIVDNAVSIAQTFWLSNAFIWVTIVAIWTSLPELASSVMAALKKDTNMALWWIIWSNIFNILWILGFPALFAGMNAYSWISVDLWIMTFLSAVLLVFAFSWEKYMLTKINWFILVSIYFGYLSYLIYNL